MELLQKASLSRKNPTSASAISNMAKFRHFTRLRPIHLFLLATSLTEMLSLTRPPLFCNQHLPIFVRWDVSKIPRARYRRLGAFLRSAGEHGRLRPSQVEDSKRNFEMSFLSVFPFRILLPILCSTKMNKFMKWSNNYYALQLIFKYRPEEIVVTTWKVTRNPRLFLIVFQPGPQRDGGQQSGKIHSYVDDRNETPSILALAHTFSFPPHFLLLLFCMRIPEMFPFNLLCYRFLVSSSYDVYRMSNEKS